MIRISKKNEERKNEIMDAALKLFMERGFESTTVSDIVKAVSIAQGTFYYYFKSKEEILDAIINKVIGEMIEKLEVIAEDMLIDSIKKINITFMHIGTIVKEYISIANYLHKNKYNLLHIKLVDTFIELYTPIFTLLIKQGKKEGFFNVEYEFETALLLLTGMSKLIHNLDLETQHKKHIYEKLKAFDYLLKKILGTERDIIDLSLLFPNDTLS